jgi:hypothetical protein
MTQTHVEFGGLERRARHDLRAIFPAACEALRPFFEPGNQWAGQSHEHWALQALKEEFPLLNPQDAYLVVLTVKKMIDMGGYQPVAPASTST